MNTFQVVLTTGMLLLVAQAIFLEKKLADPIKQTVLRWAARFAIYVGTFLLWEGLIYLAAFFMTIR